MTYHALFSAAKCAAWHNRGVYELSVWPDFLVEGKYVNIVPLTKDHHQDLAGAAINKEPYSLWHQKIVTRKHNFWQTMDLLPQSMRTDFAIIQP